MLNMIEEEKFADLKRRCKELGVPAPPEVHIRTQLFNRTGDLLDDDIRRGHSWVRNAYNVAFSHWSNCGASSTSFGAGYLSAKRYGGSVDGTATAPCGAGVSTAGDTNGYQAAAADTLAGIIVGTSDTAWSAEQYALGALIAHGSGSGQLAYGACAVGTPSYTAGTKTWAVDIVRNFTNNYNATLTVKEVGLVFQTGNNMHFFVSAYNGQIYNTMDRSVLSPTKDVGYLQVLAVTYTISMSFSAID